jgi:hypothetical protein
LSLRVECCCSSGSAPLMPMPTLPWQMSQCRTRRKCRFLMRT